MSIDNTGYILLYKSNFTKKKCYAINLKANNFENKLHHTVDVPRLNNSSCKNKYLYTDADNAQKQLIIKFVLTLIKYKDPEIHINPALEKPVFTYQNKGYIKLLND